MTLDDVRRTMCLQAGAIKAWALRRGTFEAIVEELGVKGVRPCNPFSSAAVPRCHLFGIPVVFVAFDQPEGVIV